MHTCCAPCSVYCIKSLREEGIEPTLFWYNPNIHPYTEYEARRDTLIKYSKMVNAKLILKSFGIDVRVVDLYSIKPVDVETIVKCASETKILVSVEDHNVIGGIGSIVSNILCEKYPKKLVKIGVQDKFGKSGKADKLYELYGITKENIVRVFKES